MPVEVTLAEIIAEGRRLEAEYDRAVRDGFDSTANALWDEECEFWIDHGPRLLAVAAAAVEWDARQEEMAAGLKRGWDRQAYVTADINLTNARCALRAAVQGAK